MLPVVRDGGAEQVGGQERGLDGGEPLREIVEDGTDPRPTMREQRVSCEATVSRILLGDIHRRDERTALGSEQRLHRLGVSEFASAMGIATGLDHAAGRVDRVEAVLGVGGEDADERRELGDDVRTRLGRLVLEHARASSRYSSR